MMLDEMASLVALWAKSLSAAGIVLTPDSSILKLGEEADELWENRSVEEAADVFISLIVACTTMGITYGDLACAVEDKMEINRERVWSKRANGTFHHDEPAVATVFNLR